MSTSWSLLYRRMKNRFFHGHIGIVQFDILSDNANPQFLFCRAGLADDGFPLAQDRAAPDSSRMRSRMKPPKPRILDHQRHGIDIVRRLQRE